MIAEFKKHERELFPSHVKNILNYRFGKVVVIKFAGVRGKYSYWLCKCDCGNEKIIRGVYLNCKDAKSCGCLAGGVTHGKSGSRIYYIWGKMIDRCYNKNNKAYKWYGVRGIKVCKRWRKFENFYKDMGDKPKGLELDRINNNGNYELSNCRWITRKEQCRNRRDNVWLKYRNRKMLQSDWAKELKVSLHFITRRLDKGINFVKIRKEAIELNDSRISVFRL